MTYVDQTGCSYSSSFTNEQTDWSSNLPPHEVVFVLVKILAIMSSPSRTGPFKYTINEVKYRLSSVVVDKIFVETAWLGFRSSQKRSICTAWHNYASIRS